MNKEGIELLKADLRANAQMYDQRTFGNQTECGTVMCMAGFCLLRKVGKEAYTNMIKTNNSNIMYAAIRAAEQQLGMEHSTWDLPTIFNMPNQWPSDLSRKYSAYKNNPTKLVEVACEALDRLNPDGSIKELKDISDE